MLGTPCALVLQRRGTLVRFEGFYALWTVLMEARHTGQVITPHARDGNAGLDTAVLSVLYIGSWGGSLWNALRL